MRRWRTLMLGLLAGLVVGCTASKPVRSTAWLDRLRQFSGLTGSDVIVMEVALLECPLADRYLNGELWTVADEQVVALERKAVLEDNGFRVGQVGGLVPNRLQALLTSERSCPRPRRIQLRSGNATSIALGPVLSEGECQIHQDGWPKSLPMESAQCALVVAPTVMSDRRVRLHFTPQVQHKSTTVSPSPAPDRSGWMLQEQRPTERYPALSWEVALAPNEYLLIGARPDRPETLGHQCFLRRDEPVPVQRLLVIRTAGPAASLESGPPFSTEQSHSFSRSPSLALQAAWTKVRGTSP